MKRFLWFGHDDGERTHGGGLDDLYGDFETLTETFAAIKTDNSFFAVWQILDTATGDMLRGTPADLGVKNTRTAYRLIQHAPRFSY